jgi:Kelch motif
MPRYYLGIVLAALATFAITACGGSGDSINCSPAPKITSAPPTNVTVGYSYNYLVNASYTCIPFTCHNIVALILPAGAHCDGYSIWWTPTADQANKDLNFKIATAPDTCGDSAIQFWTVHVNSAPVIETFNAARTALKSGESTTITAVFQGIGSIEGLGPITSGIPIATPALNTTTNFTLVVNNGFGTEVRQTLTIQVLLPPVIQSFSASPSTITAGGTTLLSWSATGDFTAHLDPLGVDVTGPNFTVSPPFTTTYVLTLSNATGASTSASVQVVVIPPPSILSFTATPTSSVLQGTVSLLAQFSSGTGEVIRDDVVTSTSLGPIMSGVAISSGELFRNTSFQLVVRNAVGTAVTQKLFVPISGPGTFQPTIGQPIGAFRSGHTATRLLDGRVFIAGGQLSNTCSVSTEIFDPVTETFIAGPNLIEGRADHAAALLPDGRVLLVGGFRTDHTYIPNVEIYDPESQTVISNDNLSDTTFVSPKLSALLDGRMLIVLHTSYGHVIKVFTPGTNTFTPLGPLNVSHRYVSLERLADGRVLIIDGQGSPSELFSPATDSYVLTDAVSHGGRWYFSSATLLDGRVLVTGGSTSLMPAEVYDPTTGLFSDAGTQQYQAADGATANTLGNGAVLVVGGLVNGWGSPWAELFDPATGAFSMTGGCARGHRFHTATVLQDGRVLVFGGCDAVPSPCAEIYTPQ